MKFIFLVALLSLFFTPLFSQPSNGVDDPVSVVASRKGTMKGKIIERGSKTPLEYANIAVYSAKDSSLAGGGSANVNGEFLISDLKPGLYYIDAKFIGYEHTKKANIRIDKDKLDIDLGVVILNPASENIQEVNVIAQDHPIVYEIDKKVIDPSQFPTAANGTAADVLANTPSVVVDIEGNVTLRGSSSFMVLIDGRPTPFDAADALEQIPASTIRNIEIITNPSAKFDPDGNAGIININTKKSKMTGISGIVNATGDTNGSISGDFLFNYRFDKFNFFLSGNKSNRMRQGNYSSLSETYGEDTITTTSNGSRKRGRDSWSVKTGFDYYFNDYNTLTFNLSLNGRNRFNNGLSDFHEFSTNGYELYSLTESNSDGKSDNIAYSIDYRKTFDKVGHEFTAYAYYETGNGNELSLYDQFDSEDNLIGGQKNWEVGDDKEFRFKADYVYPFTTKTKVEAGYQARIDRSYEWNDVHWYDTFDNYEASTSSPYYSDTYFNRDIHSMYSTFSNSGSIMGYQFGLRAEYTNRSLDFSGSDSVYAIDRWDFFPTIHFSFKLPLEQQLTASYTRRIDRPRGYYLEPFITYVDAYNVRTGNPGIEPEYIDSYEIGYQKEVGKGFLSTELYHRKTNNKIERITSVYYDNVMIQSVDNIGSDYSTGLELMLNMNPFKWWMINLMGNAYYYKVEGEIEGRSIDQTSNNWHARFSNTFSLTKTTKLQFDGMYHSPRTTAQGKREGFMFTNFAVRQDLFKNKLNLTLSVRDVFNTAKFGFEASGSNFYSKRNFDMKSPVFAITVSYKLNNYRQKKEPGSNGTGGENGMMDSEGGGDF